MRHKLFLLKALWQNTKKKMAIKGLWATGYEQDCNNLEKDLWVMQNQEIFLKIKKQN
jgi:hypothetical protein